MARKCLNGVVGTQGTTSIYTPPGVRLGGFATRTSLDFMPLFRARAGGSFRVAVPLTVAAVLLVTAVHGSRAHAQAPAPAPGAPVRRVSPGDTSLRVSALVADTAVYFLNFYRGDEEISVGTITDVLTRTTGGTPQLRRVLMVERGQTRLTDSTLSDGRTLAPRRRYSWQPQRELRLEFSGLKVKGMLGMPETPGVPLDTVQSVPSFDAGNWDLVLRALPLAENYEAEFPVFDVETGTHLYGVRVIGSTPMMGETAHIAMFRLGGAVEVKVWIGATTRRLLQVETPMGGSAYLMQTLRPTSGDRER